MRNHGHTKNVGGGIRLGIYSKGVLPGLAERLGVGNENNRS